MSIRFCRSVIVVLSALLVTNEVLVTHAEGQQEPIGEARIVASDASTIQSASDGVIEFLIENGTAVEEGDLLARINSDAARLAVEKSKSQLMRSRAEFEAGQVSAQTSLIRQEAEIEILQTKLERARLEAELILAEDGEMHLREVRLKSKLTLSEQQLELYERLLGMLDQDRREERIKAIEIELSLAEARYEVITTKAELSFLLQHEKPRVELEARSQVKQAEIELANAMEQLNQLRREHEALTATMTQMLADVEASLEKHQAALAANEIRSPRAGRVVHLGPQAFAARRASVLREGATIRNRQPLLMVANDDMLQADVSILDPTGKLTFEEGQEVVLRVDAFPDRRIIGKITGVLQRKRTGAGGAMATRFTVDLDGSMNQLEGVLASMTATVEFEKVDE